MPQYKGANLVKAQTIMTAMFARAAVRFRQPATFMEFTRNREIMLPSHNVVRGREDRAVEVIYNKRSARALGSTRSHGHTGTKGDSDVLTPVWQTLTDVFNYSLKQADNNVQSLDQQIANEFANVLANFAVGADQLAAEYLFNNRTQENSYGRQGVWNGTQDVFVIDGTDEKARARAIQISKTVMDAHDYQGIPYVFFCDSMAYDIFEAQSAQGSGNSENLAFNFSNARFVKSLGLDALFAALGTPYVEGAWIVVPEGMIGCLDWIPKQNRAAVETKVNKYGNLINPIDGLLYGTHEYEARYNGSSTGDNDNGYTQDVKNEVEVSIDIALEHAPTDVANTSPMYAFAFGS